MRYMTDEHKQFIRQYAQEFITGTRCEMQGPEAGYIFLWMLATLEAWETEVAALQERLDEGAAGREDIHTRLETQCGTIDALALDVEELRDLMEHQRETIEALIEENDDLRAKLYVQDRQKPGDATA